MALLTLYFRVFPLKLISFIVFCFMPEGSGLPGLECVTAGALLRKALFMYISMTADAFSRQAEICFFIFMTFNTLCLVAVFQNVAGPVMEKFLFIKLHDVIIRPLMIRMTINTSALYNCVKALARIYVFIKFFMACPAGRVMYVAVK